MIWRGALRRFLRPAPVWIAYGTLVTAASGFIVAPLIARALGPDGRGITSAAIAAMNLVPIFLAMGMPLVLRRRAAISDAAAEVRSFRDLSVLAFVPAGLVAWLLCATVFHQLPPLEVLLVGVGITLCPLAMLWMADASILVAREDYRAIFVLRIAQPASFAILIVLSWLWSSLSIAWVVGAQVVANVIAVVIGASLVRVRVRGTRAKYGALLSGGLRFAGASIAEAVSFRLDQLLIVPIAGAAQAGLYSVAATIGSVPIFVAHSISAPYFRRAAAAEPVQRPTIHREGLRATSSVSVVVTGLLIVLAVPGVPLLFGAEFAAAVPATQLYLAGAFFASIGAMLSLFLAADDRGRAMTLSQFVALGLSLVVLFLLGPILGAVGASIATAMSYLALTAMLAYFLRVGVGSLMPTPKGFVRGVSVLFVK